MALGSDYDKLCKLFDCINDTGGVPWCYRPRNQLYNTSYTLAFGSANTSAEIQFRLPMKVLFYTCLAYACSDAQGLKDGSGSTEPVIGVCYAASANATFATAGDGTEIATITCGGTADDTQKIWYGSTTATVIEAMAPICVYLKTASGTASSTSDGAAVVELWFKTINAE